MSKNVELKETQYVFHPCLAVVTSVSIDVAMVTSCCVMLPWWLQSVWHCCRGEFSLWGDVHSLVTFVCVEMCCYGDFVRSWWLQCLMMCHSGYFSLCGDVTMFSSLCSDVAMVTSIFMVMSQWWLVQCAWWLQSALSCYYGDISLPGHVTMTSVCRVMSPWWLQSAVSCYYGDISLHCHVTMATSVCLVMSPWWLQSAGSCHHGDFSLTVMCHHACDVLVATRPLTSPFNHTGTECANWVLLFKVAFTAFHFWLHGPYFTGAWAFCTFCVYEYAK